VQKLSIALTRSQDARIFIHLANSHIAIAEGVVYESAHPFWFRFRNAEVTGYSFQSSGPDKGGARISMRVTGWTPFPQ
jgi:hypothetical protein